MKSETCLFTINKNEKRRNFCIPQTVLKSIQNSDSKKRKKKFPGDMGNRTPDFSHAKRALYPWAISPTKKLFRKAGTTHFPFRFFPFFECECGGHVSFFSLFHSSPSEHTFSSAAFFVFPSKRRIFWNLSFFLPKIAVNCLLIYVKKPKNYNTFSRKCFDIKFIH